MKIMIEFKVFGEPVGKGRPRFSSYSGPYTPEKTASYENLVRLSYKQQCGNVKPFDKSMMLIVQIMAFFTIPKNTSKKKTQRMIDGHERPVKRPDTDNIAKAVLDALNGIAYHDDAQIVSLSVDKFYSNEPKTVVRIGVVS